MLPSILIHSRVSLSSPQAPSLRLRQRLERSQPLAPRRPLEVALPPQLHHSLSFSPQQICFCFLHSSPSVSSAASVSVTSLLPQSAQYASEAVARLPGRPGGPVGVGWWRASSAHHKPGYELVLWPVSTQAGAPRW